MNKYNWSNVPQWVNYIFTDKDGDRFGCDNKPDNAEGFHGSPHLDNWIYLGNSPIEDWQESLEERPNE